jgi:hypothetical protein
VMITDALVEIRTGGFLTTGLERYGCSSPLERTKVSERNFRNALRRNVLLPTYNCTASVSLITWSAAHIPDAGCEATSEKSHNQFVYEISAGNLISFHLHRKHLTSHKALGSLC